MHATSPFRTSGFLALTMLLALGGPLTSARAFDFFGQGPGAPPGESASALLQDPPPEPSETSEFTWGATLDRLFPKALRLAAKKASAPTGRRSSSSGPLREGMASYYGRRFHGRRTANGETFDMNALTAASPDLPLGSWVRVLRVDTGRSLVVRINDRGPFRMHANGRPVRPLEPHPTRVVDLSREAMRRLGGLDAGQIRVEVHAVE